MGPVFDRPFFLPRAKDSARDGVFIGEKSPMKSSIRLLATSLLLLALADVSHAADAGPPATSPTRSAPVERPLVSIDFPGGSVTKFLSMVAQNQHVSFNIIATGGPAELATELPPFALRNADVGTVAVVLRNLLLPRGFDLQPIGGQPDSFVCTLSPLERPRQDKTPQHQFESYQLAPYLDEQSVDDIVGAMRAAWELAPGHEPDALRLKFHPATTILLASGPLDAINITRQVLVQLKRSSGKESKDKDRAKPPSSDKN